VLDIRDSRKAEVHEATEALVAVDSYMTTPAPGAATAERVESSPTPTPEQILNYIDMVHRRAA
jgi:hypothetical protein